MKYRMSATALDNHPMALATVYVGHTVRTCAPPTQLLLSLADYSAVCMYVASMQRHDGFRRGAMGRSGHTIYWY